MAYSKRELKQIRRELKGKFQQMYDYDDELEYLADDYGQHYDEDGNLPTDSSHYENIWGKGGLQDNWVDDHIKNITSRKPQEMETYYEVEIPYTRDELISEEFFVEPKKKRVKRKGAKLM